MRSGGSAVAASLDEPETSARRATKRRVRPQNRPQIRYTTFQVRSCKWLICEKPEIRRPDSKTENANRYDRYVPDLPADEDGSFRHRSDQREPDIAVRCRPTARGRRTDAGLFDIPMRAIAEVRESFGEFGTTNADGVAAKRAKHLRRYGRFAGVAVRAMLLRTRQRQGHIRLRHLGAREYRRAFVDPSGGEGPVSALAWVWKGQPTFALEGIINYSSATIAWLKDQLGLIDDWLRRTAAMARAVENNGGVYFVPAFGGLSEPYWSPNARAVIVGMTAHSTRNTLFGLR